MTAGIYKIESPSGKCYIGQSTNMERRWKEHCFKKSECYGIKCAINKHGKENMTFEIIKELPKNKIILNSYEIYFIQFLNSLSPNGYNLNTGGCCFEMSIETKQKMSNSRKGKIPGNKGKPAWNVGVSPSEETKKKMSEAKKGKPSLNKGKKGKPHTDQFKEEHSKRMTGIGNSFFGKTHTEETKKKQSEAKKGKSPGNKGKKFNKETRKYE